MNIIDIIIVVCVATGGVLGFCNGVIRQLGSLAGVIIAIFLAKGFGDMAAKVFNIGGDNAHFWGFAIVLIVSLIAAAALTFLLRKIVSAAGLGTIDRLMGAALGALKYLLILSLALLVFDFFNSPLEIVQSKYINSSKLYRPTISVTQYILPSIEWVGENLPIPEKKE